MTTIPFLPNTTSAPPFQATVTLDGNSYLLATTWNFYRPDWYVLLVDQNGNIVANQPLIGSPSNAPIALFPGLFSVSTITYFATTQNFVITP
jgi:hypothetical protein